MAALRLGVLGSLINAPIEKGELQERIRALSQQIWTDPRDGRQRRFGFSTIEKWYYKTRAHPNPYEILQLKRRVDEGLARALTAPMIEYLEKLYVQHPKWTIQLHYDNFKIWCKVRTFRVLLMGV
jgi:hypothetical protein